MAGLGFALALFLVLGATGVASGGDLAVVAVFGQFLGLVVAGYVAGRLTGPDAVLNGGLAGLGAFAVAVTLSLARGAAPGVGPLLLLGVVAAVSGSSGGVLAAHRHR